MPFYSSICVCLAPEGNVEGQSEHDFDFFFSSEISISVLHKVPCYYYYCFLVLLFLQGKHLVKIRIFTKYVVIVLRAPCNLATVTAYSMSVSELAL